MYGKQGKRYCFYIFRSREVNFIERTNRRGGKQGNRRNGMRFTMGELAKQLGMSTKTLYGVFRPKMNSLPKFSQGY